MDVNSLLTSDGDIKALRNTVISMKTTLQMAAHDYAKAALGAANEALKCVQKAAPAGVVWPHIAEYQTLAGKANNALEATMSATQMLLNSEETGDPEIDYANAVAKAETIDAHVVQALLEGAAIRMNMTLRCIPEGASAGQRTNPKALKPKETKNGR